jgi:hypothetical protein
MAFTTQTRRWHWIQIAVLTALGVVVVVSAAFGRHSGGGRADSGDRQTTPIQDQEPTWPPKSVGEINVDPHDHSDQKPADASVRLFETAPTNHWFNTPFAFQIVHWTAPNICFQPLYFEDVRLERCGERAWGCLDVARSGTLFYADALALPLKPLWVSPHDCVRPF